MADYCGSAACGCCRCCCSFILTSGLTAFFIWLSLRTSNPKCSVEDFYIPGLNRSDNSTLTNYNNDNITLKLKFENVMKDKDVRYDELNLTLVYYTQNTSKVIGNMTMKRFKQGHSKKAHKQETLVAYGMPWEEAKGNNKSAIFGVNLATRVKFKIMFWYTKKHHWNFVANVTVDDTGKRAGSSVHRPMCYGALLAFFISFSFTF